MPKVLISQRFELISLEKAKLLRSAGWALLSLLALGLVSYLEKYGLPESLKYLTPMLPFIINALSKWAGEHTYSVK